MKNKSTAILLTALGLIGFAGFQHFYMGKILKGLLWFFTGGIFLIGTIVDLFTMSSQVDNHNTKIELQTIRTVAMNK